MLANIKLSWKSLFPVLIFAVGIGALASFTILEARSTMLTERRTLVRSMVEAALSMAAGFEGQVRAGTLTREEARARLITALGAVRYQGNEYYFVFDTRGVMLAHPNPQFIGTNRWNIQGQDGRYNARELIAAAQRGGDFVLYSAARAGGTEPQPKISYAAVSAPFDMVIGTGVYVDDIDAAVWRAGRNIALVALLTLLVGAITAIGLAREFVRPINALSARARSLSNGDVSGLVPGAQRGDEVGELARAVEVFRQNSERLAQADGERHEREQRANARAQIEEQLVASVGTVVDAARMGDFSVRTEASVELGRLSTLVTGLNAVTAACEGFLDEADSALARLAAGDLSARMSADFDGRLAAVAENFNRAAESLSSTIDEVMEGAVATRHAVEGIGSATRSLSSRTESQAAALEETSAAVEEIAKTVAGTASTVEKAAQGAEENSARAVHGSDVARNAVNAIDRVDAQAKKIVEIVGVMDGLAFQTNLLALNASVEAARAGDAGRGFAVVANEVRRLAQQSAEAARDVRTLIAETNAHVGEGVALVKTVGEELGVISATARDVAQTFIEIRHATREQSTGIDEIARALQQMDEMTQANAAAAEETATNAGQLVSTAETLSSLTERFSTRGASAAPRRRAA